MAGLITGAAALFAAALGAAAHAATSPKPGDGERGADLVPEPTPCFATAIRAWLPVRARLNVPAESAAPATSSRPSPRVARLRRVVLKAPDRQRRLDRRSTQRRESRRTLTGRPRRTGPQPLRNDRQGRVLRSAGGTLPLPIAPQVVTHRCQARSRNVRFSAFAVGKITPHAERAVRATPRTAQSKHRGNGMSTNGNGYWGPTGGPGPGPGGQPGQGPGHQPYPGAGHHPHPGGLGVGPYPPQP
ncbi:hypothetical protein GA0115260_111031, partial [Streptomyces sp. MnatMP-M27]